MRISLVCSLLLFTCFLFGQKQFEFFFDSNKDIPSEKSKMEFEKILITNSELEILSISGYCDSIDDSFYNKELAKRRINSIIEMFNEKSILIAENVVIKVIGEDFVQSKRQDENRKVVVEYKERAIKTDSVSEIEEIIIISDDKVEDERILLIEKFEKARIGDRIAIYNINFKFNSEAIEKNSKPLLDELFYIMESNPKLVIKIHGHICCNPNPYNTKLSYRRALKIFNYLKEKGINQNRLSYNGVGSNNPIYPIPEKNEEERIANRRVEIEIVRK